jgi:hypothetical protein
MEMFVYSAFHDAFFGSHGLVGRMQMFRFDCKVVEKYYKTRCAVDRYSQELRQLMKRYNDSALETLNLALNFIEKQSYEENLSDWIMLNILVNEELKVHSNIHSLLDNLAPL